jgi:hypothetical protein
MAPAPRLGKPLREIAPGRQAPHKLREHQIHQGQGMANLSISRAWDEARTIIARDGKLLVAVALALIVLPQTIAGVIAPPVAGGELSNQLVVMAAALIGIAAQLALIRLALGPSTSVGEAIGHGFRRFPIFLLSTILLVVAYLLLLFPVALIAMAMGMSVPEPGAPPTGGLALLFLLSILLFLAITARLILLAPVVSAERVGPISALKRSWALTSGHYWRFVGLLLLFLLLALVLMGFAGMLGGILAKLIDPDLQPMSIGAFVIALFSSLAQAMFTILASTLLARVYVQLSGASEPQASVPSSANS